MCLPDISKFNSSAYLTPASSGNATSKYASSLTCLPLAPPFDVKPKNNPSSAIKSGVELISSSCFSIPITAATSPPGIEPITPVANALYTS